MIPQNPLLFSPLLPMALPHLRVHHVWPKQALFSFLCPGWTHSPDSGLLLWTGLPPEMVGRELNSCVPCCRGRGVSSPSPPRDRSALCPGSGAHVTRFLWNAGVLGVVGLSVKGMLGERKVGAERATQWSGPVSDGLCGRNSTGLSSLDCCLASSCPTLLHFPSVTLQTFSPASRLGCALVGRY